jgi:predicted DCC family thiol-disulfide oxidoreductase YuxK
MSADVVVYDGDCGICEWSATWIKQHVPGVKVVSHREYGVSYLSSVWFITWAGRFEGAHAVSEILKRSNIKLFQVIGTIIGLPVVRIVAKGVYFVVAKNRRRISKLFGLRTCAVPNR